MSYDRSVGEDHPGLFVFVLDQSGSMAANWPGNTASAAIKKAQFLSDIINKVIREIGANAVTPERIKHRCDIALIGYEGGKAYSLWGGALNGRDIVGIPEIVENPLGTAVRKEQRSDPIEGVIEVDRKTDYWIEPAYGGATPMGMALAKARQTIEVWMQDAKHHDSFPPVVIHVTDGMPDASERQTALKEAEAIKQLFTNDGNALLITIHIPDGYGQTILFPISPNDLPTGDSSAALLFEMASVLPSGKLEGAAREAGLDVQTGSRLMIMNADALAAAKLISWGSSTSGATRQ